MRVVLSAALSTLSAVSALVVLSACAPSAPTGPRFSPAPPPAANRSLVYVYRIDRVSGVGSVRLRLQGGQEFELRNGEYAPLVVRPGGRTLALSLPLFGGVPRGWSELPFTARPGETQYVRIWAGTDEVDRGPQGRPDDFGAPGRGDRYAAVNVFANVAPTREAEARIRDLQLAPGLPPGVQ